MSSTLKEHWKEFKRGTPGRRFQDRYERNKDKRESESWHHKFLQLGIALGLLAIGVVLLVFPGPGILFVVASAAVLADRSLMLSRTLDWIELKGRRILRTIKQWWRRASWLARTSAVLAGLLGSGAAGYIVYRVVT